MIQDHIALPTEDERARVEIFNAADAEIDRLARVSPDHSGASELGFRRSIRRCRSVFAVVEMPIITVALNRNPSRFTNGVFERGNRLLLRRGGAGHMEDLFLHYCAV